MCLRNATERDPVHEVDVSLAGHRHGSPVVTERRSKTWAQMQMVQLMRVFLVKWEARSPAESEGGEGGTRGLRREGI